MRSDPCANRSRIIGFPRTRTGQADRTTTPAITLTAGALCALAVGLAICFALGIAGIVPDQANAGTKRPASTAFLKAKATPARVSLTWKRAKTISGYQIKFATNKRMKHATTKRITKASKTRTTLHAKPGKTYWIKIRTYKKSNGVRIYSRWSKKLKVRIPRATSSNPINQTQPANPCTHAWTKKPVTKYVVTSSAWEELVAKDSVYFCNGCNAEFKDSNAWKTHSDQMVDRGDDSHDSYRGPETIYETIKHPEEGYLEIIGYQSVCSKCGEIVKG